LCFGTISERANNGVAMQRPEEPEDIRLLRVSVLILVMPRAKRLSISKPEEKAVMIALAAC
jgi:hypothetical protein